MDEYGVDISQLGGFSGWDFSPSVSLSSGSGDAGGGFGDTGGGADPGFTFSSSTSAPLDSGVPGFANTLTDAYNSWLGASPSVDISNLPLDNAPAFSDFLGAGLSSFAGGGPSTTPSSVSTNSIPGQFWLSKLGNFLSKIHMTAGSGAGASGGSGGGGAVAPKQQAAAPSSISWLVWVVVIIIGLVIIRGLTAKG